ncbi:2-amino-4-hydroxy-6-hydroxymethyldihydropteridinepyrophosphokinase [BD1-7 clade bacterium]|uniref:2-amino-4-hydroxy-6-hydroxymethyldihydropteridine diphosphokinase n=1 Tax=BD1-7 clade bacterium TaxID=2029982 RepID=A0A5S9QX18_9GAMM|nr:2-amino-4-hydroxy-6-hydroxymethyldihydropteridinepyrophosphokinase [BD1-7 clade bacterium]
MATVLLGIGSNVNREKNIASGLQALRGELGAFRCSPVYESAAVGFDGDPFLNLVIQIDTSLAVGELRHYLRALENDFGRVRACDKFSSRTLDVDILTYDNAVGVVDGVSLPRDEILTNAFVLKPLADLVPDAVHPRADRSYAALWADYPNHSQSLWLAEFQISDSDFI